MRHYERHGVSNHQHIDCLLSRLLRRKSKKASKLHVTGLCAGNSPVIGGVPCKGPVAQKMFPLFDINMDEGDNFILDLEWTNFRSGTVSPSTNVDRKLYQFILPCNATNKYCIKYKCYSIIWHYLYCAVVKMTSWRGNAFRITVITLCGESTSHQGIAS